MKKRYRLTGRRDFAAVMGGPRLFSGKGLLALASPRGPGEPRVGVTVSRQVKGAVARNRARRRLREVVRTVLLAEDSPLRERGIRYDVVLIARPGALRLPLPALEAEARGFLNKLAAPGRGPVR